MVWVLFRTVAMTLLLSSLMAHGRAHQVVVRRSSGSTPPHYTGRVQARSPSARHHFAASTYTQACFPDASRAAIRLYAATCSYRSAAASSASVISNTVPLTRLSSLPLNVTLE